MRKVKGVRHTERLRLSNSRQLLGYSPCDTGCVTGAGGEPLPCSIHTFKLAPRKHDRAMHVIGFERYLVGFWLFNGDAKPEAPETTVKTYAAITRVIVSAIEAGASAKIAGKVN